MSDENLNVITASYSESYLNLVENALNKINELVQSQGGRMTLFEDDQLWDEENGVIRPEMYEKLLILNINKGTHTVEMYPVDLLYNNGSVRVIFLDEHGDKINMYTDEMEDFAVCIMADFLHSVYREGDNE